MKVKCIANTGEALSEKSIEAGDSKNVEEIFSCLVKENGLISVGKFDGSVQYRNGREPFICHYQRKRDYFKSFFHS